MYCSFSLIAGTKLIEVDKGAWVNMTPGCGNNSREDLLPLDHTLAIPAYIGNTVSRGTHDTHNTLDTRSTNNAARHI